MYVLFEIGAFELVAIIDVLLVEQFFHMNFEVAEDNVTSSGGSTEKKI